MIEVHGRILPTHVREKCALGIITLFPCLRDPYSKNGYEHYYDADGGSGYLAWRIKTVDQDFTMMFGEEISGKMLARWPTFFKPRILADCKNLHSNVHVDDLLSAQQNSNESGWDSDLSSILLLISQDWSQC
ncbi:hypothetical protein CesoFtcFv8_001214 [Champsocephalus esox]|uniref:Uncharacterized protein n=1 Tax=Champsocephalus esox TaxID=159716 RepID=A0AAN8D494_9TELE|nr:hypothetical protein CesoFtcFv8_001214 [Champsocephalus esox]